MRSWCGLALGALLASSSGCGSTLLLLPSDDAAADAAAVDASALPDAGAPLDRAAAPDLPAPDDAPAPADTPTDDAPTAADVATTVDAPTVDAPPAADVATTVDVVTADAPADVASAADVRPPVDAPPPCPNGLSDTCPAALPGLCDNLADGAAHTITFAGLTTGLPASCEGAMTGAGPDGVAPLTITTPSDLVLVATPTGGDSAVITLSAAAGCGRGADEIRCANSSAPGAGGVATLRASGLGPGTYAVTVSTIRGNPTLVQATVTPARPRPRGDVCPGVAVTPDGAPVSLATAAFAGDADHGTTCGSNTNPAGWVDAVYSYTLTAARDVTVTVSATGTGDVALDVGTTCGQRATAIPACASGNPARRVVRNQQPGTYYVVAEHRAAGAGGRTLVATVTTAAPTLPGPADVCPGVALAAGVPTTVPVAGLTAGSAALSCFAAARSDAVFAFTAPGPNLRRARQRGRQRRGARRLLAPVALRQRRGGRLRGARGHGLAALPGAHAGAGLQPRRGHRRHRRNHHRPLPHRARGGGDVGHGQRELRRSQHHAHDGRRLPRQLVGGAAGHRRAPLRRPRLRGRPRGVLPAHPRGPPSGRGQHPRVGASTRSCRSTAATPARAAR